MKSAYLRIANTTHSRWAKDLFEGVTVDVRGGDIVWIIGPNGAWKSTLLHILAWDLVPDMWTRESKWTIGIVTQWMELQWEQIIGEYLLWDSWREDREALVALWKAWWDELSLTTKLHVLSWGQRTKVRLAKCLMDEVDILLLDEPTNHLDSESVALLQWIIRRRHGPVVFVSHDRTFLDAVCTHIVDVRYEWVEQYVWTYTQYINQREERAQKQLQLYKLQERKRKAMELWLHRVRERASVYKSPRRWKLLKSREKHYDRTFGNSIAKPRDEKTIQMSVWWSIHDKKVVVTIAWWSIGWRWNTLYEMDTMKILWEDRLLISGANGSGKSTLLSFLIRAYQDTSLSQRIHRWSNIRIGTMSQHDLQQYDHHTVMQRCEKQFPEDRDQSMITMKLVSAGIPKEDIIKKISQLSYGQRVKIRFIQLMSQSYECLIIDEPTNHLDIDTRESLEAMLVQYEWALIVVSHDERFVDKIGINREWRIEEGMLVE